MATAVVAQGSRSDLYYKKQSALGTVATGNFNTLRYNTHSLNVVKESVESAEIRSDREVQDFRHGNRHCNGTITTELCFADHDDLIESAMFQAFDTDSVDIGTSPQYLSIEDGQLDISQYQMFQDLLCSTMRVSIAPNAMVTAEFDMVGTNGAAFASSSSGGTAVAPSSNSPFDSFTGALFDNAAETGDELAVVTALEFTVENNVQPAFVVGQATPLGLEYGRGRVTGQVSMYFENALFINRFLAESETALVMNLTDPGGNTMEFRFPRTKFTGADKPVQNEQGRIITLPFVALRDSSLGTAFRITKA